MSLNHKTAIVFFLLLLMPIAALAQQPVLKHTVQQGETLYGLSHKYGVTVEQIMQANEGLTFENLKAGTCILVPSNGTGQPACREMHRVKKGETLWSISHMYGLTVDELIAANPGMGAPDYKLKKGSDICIPYPAPPVQVSSEAVDSLAATDSHKPLEKINVSLILPLTSENAEGERSVEFYRGFLMAVEEIKKSGKSVSVFVFDERQGDASLADILEKVKEYHTHLIIGPVYPAHYAEVCKFATAEGIKVCAPFSSKVQEIETCPQLFLVNAPDANKRTYAADLFSQTFPHAKVVFVQTERKNETAFTSLLAAKLRTAGNETATLPLGFTPEQLKGCLAAERLTVLVPDASDRNTLTSLLQQLKAFRTEYPGSQTALFGYPDWLVYKEREPEDLYDENAYIYTNFYYNPYASQVRTLEAAYQRWFNTKLIETHPRMALLGYDEGLYMMTGLAKYGTGFTTQFLSIPTLQSRIAFDTGQGESGGYINRSMMFIHYRTDGTIEKISAR